MPGQTLAHLAARQGFEVRIDAAERLSNVWDYLLKNPLLPGVLVFDRDRFLTAISRSTFSERLLYRFGRELFSHKPARLFVETVRPTCLELDSSVLIADAAMTLAGYQGDISAPIVIRHPDNRRVLIDGRHLFIASCVIAERVAQDLEQQRLAATQADRAKTEFLANMSHEIRTPMTAILGFADLLDSVETTPHTRHEHVDTIRRNGQHLLSIINDILDLSKIEANQMTVERLPTSPVRIVEEVLSLMGVRAKSKGIDLRCDWIWPHPAEIFSDPIRLRQILINLVGNAIKFTDTGSVRLRVSWDPDERQMDFAVSDPGVGMTAEQVVKVFRPFTQADETTTRRFGGTGMGLSISKRLASMLGGDIHVLSSPGAGSTFTLSLNVEPHGPMLLEYPGGTTSEAPPAAASAPTTTPLHGLRVLLAEDGTDNQRLISFHLRKAGAEVAIAENGKLAADSAISAADTGSPFDLILMDMQMPVMDGYSATQLLRSQGYRGRIIALTAHAMNGDRDRCLRAGSDDSLSKPVDRKLLIDACQARIPAAVSRAES